MSLPAEFEAVTRDEELARLARALRLARGFRLYFARSLPGEPRSALLEGLAALIEGEVRIFDARPGLDHLRSALASELEGGASPKAACVTGIETWVPAGNAGAASAFVRNLNASRDRFADSVPCPLVVWGADHVLRAIQHGAPDFFSVASGIYLFSEDVSASPREVAPDAPTLEGAARWLRELEEVEERLQAVDSKGEGTDAVDRISLKNRNVFLLSHLARYDEAERFAIRLLDEALQTLGEDHPDALTSANNLAGLYESTGRYAEAEPLYASTLATRRRVLGEDHPDTLASTNNLAYLYRITGRKEDARSILAPFLPAARRLPERHEVRKAFENNYQTLMSELGETEP